jgi:hypothetical protein
MKAAYILTYLFLFSPVLYAQHTVKADTIKPAKGNVEKQLEQIKGRKIKLHSDSTGNEPLKSRLIDTTIQNRYGDLLNDDPKYNKKFPLLQSTIGVLISDVSTWLADRYVLHTKYSHIGSVTWKYNLKNGWEWNNDKFGTNFVVNPYLGTLSYNGSRSIGYNYYQSATFAVAGSLIWEYFGQSRRPSYNDLIYTSINGAFLGEIFYRISSNILDDRTRGGERVFREILAGLIDPKRGFDRLLQGKTFRVTNKEVYQKEPLNVSLFTGIHMINDQTGGYFGKVTYSEMTNIQLDYGNPFELRLRKPFDFFKLRAELNFGVGSKFLDNISGYGILFGKNMQLGKMAILIGGFQYYDYWDNHEFELGSIGFGGGVFTKLPISKTLELYTNVHLALVPFAGNSIPYGADTSQLRDYDFGDGAEGKFESTLNLGKYASISLIYYYFIIHTYIGTPGNNYMGILKPRITVRLFKNISVGFEQYLYSDNRHLSDYADIHLNRTEEKIFLLLYLEDPQRRGHYN